MPDTFTFPKGFEVKVYRKQDILDCIDANIIDKETAYAVISQCELDASNFIQTGRWTGIPFIGNIRVPKAKQMFNSPENQELLETARDTMAHDKYVLFRKTLAIDIAKKEKQERLYKHIVSLVASKNPHLFRKLSKEHGDAYARFYLYCISDVDVVKRYEV